MREARLVARLSHPHIMSIFDVGQEQDWAYLVLEHIPGKDLHSLMLERNTTLSVGEVMQILHPVLDALMYAHEQEIIHRDIKPENIMLTPNGLVKVTDFGLALAHGDNRLTQGGGLVGTVLYMSPEIIQGKEIDQRADLYSLGAVLYELLTGRPPFVGEQLAQVISQVLYADLLSPGELRPGLPAELERVILKLLARDPEARFASARQVLDALPAPGADNGLVLDNSETSSLPASETTPPFLLPSIVRSSSSTIPPPTGSRLLEDEAPLLNLPAEADQASNLTRDLLLFASAEDIVASVESERRRLANLLQNEVVEPLNLLLSQANTYEQTLGSNQMARMAVTILATLARQALQQARDLGDNLSPALLESLGLEPALESLSNQVNRAYGLRVQLELERLRERLPRRIELALFRLAQEFLEALPSMNATQASMRLMRQDQQLDFELGCNGQGALDERIMQGTRQWLEQLGGQFLPITAGLDIPRLTVRFVLHPQVQLTQREMEVISLVAEGLSNKVIGQLLSISPRTVNFHLDNLFTKLGVRSRTEAAIYALRQGWVRQKF